MSWTCTTIFSYWKIFCFSHLHLYVNGVYFCVKCQVMIFPLQIDTCSNATNSYLPRLFLCSIRLRTSWELKAFHNIFNHILWAYLSPRPSTVALFSCQTRLLIAFTLLEYQNSIPALFISHVLSSCLFSLLNYKLLLKKTLSNSLLPPQ